MPATSLRIPDRQITVENRWIYYYASFLKGIYGFVPRRDGKNLPDQHFYGRLPTAKGRQRTLKPERNEILLFRFRKRLMLGYCRDVWTKRKRLFMHVATEDHRRLKLHGSNLVFLTGFSVAEDKAFLRTYAESIRDLGAGIDLHEIWDILQGEQERISTKEIADLYWDDDIDVTRWVSLYLHLDQTCPYFDALDSHTYSVLDESAVAEKRRHLERIDSLGHEWEEFVQWLASGEEEPYDPETLTKRHQTWLENMREYALFGTEAQNWRQARQMLSDTRTGPGNRRHAFQLLLRKGIWESEEELELERAGVPLRFTTDAEAEAGSVDVGRVVKSRKKWFARSFVIHVPDPDVPEMGISLKRRRFQRSFELGVHLPDISSLVPAGSALDQAASDRIAALALPGRYLPMLPPRISEQLGRLVPGEWRPTLSIRCRLSNHLDVKDVEILPAAVRIRDVLSAEDIDGTCAGGSPHYRPIQVLDRFAGKHRAEREAKGAVKAAGIPRMALTAHHREAEIVATDPDDAAHRIVEELGILAATAVGNYALEQDLPAIFGVRGEPAEREGLEQIGDPYVRRHEIERQTPNAECSLHAGEHSTLGTSGMASVLRPLGRYSDLLVQRQVLQHCLNGGPAHSEEEMRLVCYRMQEEWEELKGLQRRRERQWMLEDLSSRFADLHAAVVLHLRWDGVLVELTHYPLKIVVRSNREVSVGEKVNIRLTGVNLPKSRAYGSIDTEAAQQNAFGFAHSV